MAVASTEGLATDGEEKLGSYRSLQIITRDGKRKIAIKT